MIFFLFLLENRIRHIMRIWDIFARNIKTCFLGKISKPISICRLLQFFTRVLSVREAVETVADISEYSEVSVILVLFVLCGTLWLLSAEVFRRLFTIELEYTNATVVRVIIIDQCNQTAVRVVLMEGHLYNLDWDIWDIGKQLRPCGVWGSAPLA